MRTFILPANRAAVLEKTGGKALRELERRAEVEILIKHSAEGASVEINGESESEWLSEQVLRAIEIGFEPKKAMKLLNEETYLEVIDVGEAMHGKERAVERQKARIIGTGGSAKQSIEELSGAFLAVCDDGRVGIMGGFDDIKDAKEAVLRLLEGKGHGTVFSFLRHRKRRKDAETLGARVWHQKI